MTKDEAFAQLRALRALEVELDRFFTETVTDARNANMSWDEVADAVSVGRPTAWRRWKNGLDSQRVLQRNVDDLKLDSLAREQVRHMAGDLANRVLNATSSRPWAIAVRTVLNQLRVRYEWSRPSDLRTKYQLAGDDLGDNEIIIDCIEPSSDGPGGLFSTTRASGATGLRGDGTPRSDRFTTDGMVPPPDDVLVPMVTDFVLQQLRTADLLAVLNDKQVTGKTRDRVQSAYDRLCGRS
jgi:hypothetical protein